MASATFPGNSAYRLDLTTWSSSTTLYGAMSVTKTSGTGYWTAAAQPWSMNVAGAAFSGSWTYDFRTSTPQTIAVATRSYAAGYGTHYVSGAVQMDSGFGTASTGEWRTIAGVPNAPGTPIVDQQTTTSVRYRFTSAGDNGAAVIEWQAEVASAPDFSSGDLQTVSSTGTTVFTGLNPGTTYYFRARGRNSVGWGPWGASISTATLPSTPPLISVSPSASGLSAVVTLSPPSGASGVTKYVVEYRPLPAATPTTSIETIPNIVTVGGLTPGIQYEWRSSAWFGSYQSPWSGWITVQQPNPNTSPGDFFDGNSAARADVSYGWQGTVNNSTSRAVGRGVDGWVTSVVGGSAVCQQVTGGFAGSFAARMVVRAGASGAGSELGMANSSGKRGAVVAGSIYVGSIYARPSRSQRLAARIYFVNDAGITLGLETGVAQVVADTIGWTRLTVLATAPAGSTGAVVRVMDCSGAGHSNWLSGEFLDADAAMISLSAAFPYFDGSTADAADFEYEWMGTPHASASRRVMAPSQPFVVTDPDCAVIPGAPRPPAIPNECIVTIGEWRRYSFSIPSIEVSEWLDAIPTIFLSTLGAPATQVRVRFYRNPDDLSPDEYQGWDQWDGELYLSFMPANAAVTLDGITQQAYGSLQGRDRVPMNHLLYGSNGGVVSWPILSCGDSYIMAVDTPLDLAPGGLNVALDIRQRSL